MSRGRRRLNSPFQMRCVSAHRNLWIMRDYMRASAYNARRYALWKRLALYALALTGPWRTHVAPPTFLRGSEFEVVRPRLSKRQAPRGAMVIHVNAVILPITDWA